MKCRDCAHKADDYLTAYDGRGLIQFSYCNFDVTSPKMVDPDVERECDRIPEKVETPEVENAT